MATKSRFMNVCVGDTVVLSQLIYNSNNLAEPSSIEKVDIYYFDDAEKTEANPQGKRLVETIVSSNIIRDDVGTYHVNVGLDDAKYVIGKYQDEWSVILKASDPSSATKLENHFEVYPDLWYATPIPIVYDFNFSLRPNKIKKGSIRYLIIEITPNVPSSSDLARYYTNLAISSSIKISIEAACGDCLPAEQDLRLIVDKAEVEYREKQVGYYQLDTTEMDCGIYNVYFQLELGGSIYLSDAQQLQIF